MVMSTSNGNVAFLPADVGPLIERPVMEFSVAAQVSTVINTVGASFHVPIVAADPLAAWVPEGGDITPSDATLTEVAPPFCKVAGLTIITRELADDSSPSSTELVGRGLARDIARKVDAAFFADQTPEGPDGVEHVHLSGVYAGATFSDLDPFEEALSESAQEGGTITSWVTNPATALELATLKESTGSNRHLLTPDPTMPTRRQIAGVPLYVTPAVAAGVVWGIPAASTFFVVRAGTEVVADRSRYFESDRVGVRATMRVTFAFAHPAAIVKIYDTSSGESS